MLLSTSPTPAMVFLVFLGLHYSREPQAVGGLYERRTSKILKAPTASRDPSGPPARGSSPYSLWGCQRLFLMSLWRFGVDRSLYSSFPGDISRCRCPVVWKRRIDPAHAPGRNFQACNKSSPKCRQPLDYPASFFEPP